VGYKVAATYIYTDMFILAALTTGNICSF